MTMHAYEVMQRNLRQVVWLSKADAEARLMILPENETREGSSQTATHPSGMKVRQYPQPLHSRVDTFLLSLTRTVMARVEPAEGLRVPPPLDAHARRRIFLWKMEIELADLQVKRKIADLRVKGKIQAIKKLKQEAEADAPKLSGGLLETRSERRIPVRGTLFDDADRFGSEKSRTLSHGRGMSEVSGDPDTTIDETTSDAVHVEQNVPGSTLGDSENSRLKRSYDTDSDSLSPTEGDSLSQAEVTAVRIRADKRSKISGFRIWKIRRMSWSPK